MSLGNKGGRPRNAVVHREPIEGFTAQAANALPGNFDNLTMLADGGFERVELKYAPASTVTRRDIAREADGTVIRDDKGKPTVIDVPLYPDLDDDELVLVERKVSYAEPNVRACEYLVDRVMGKPRQAVELTGEDGDAIRHAVQIYLPDNGRDTRHDSDPPSTGSAGAMA
jgi:hypothetical protein